MAEEKTDQPTKKIIFTQANLSGNNDSPKYIYDFDEVAILGFDFPFTMDWLFSVAGSEYVHTYFWICKDLAWTQEWRLFALGMGISALLWSGILFYHALRTRNGHEVYNVISIFMWIFANFWWMTGEVYDFTYPDEPSISTRRTEECGIILESTLCLLLFYYLVVIPFDLIPVTEEALSEYDDGSMEPRFQYFRNYRQYENVHMLFWLAKDLSWNLDNISMWFLFLFPTILLGMDYLYLSWQVENAIVDTAHYAALLLWVMGNTVWAIGEFFFSDYDEPLKMWYSSEDAFLTARWYSSWILFSALIPIIVLYIFWLPLTCTGKLRRRRRRRLVVPSGGSGGIGSTQYGAGSGSYSYDLIEQQEDGADGEDTDGIDSEFYFADGRLDDLEERLARKRNRSKAKQQQPDGDASYYTLPPAPIEIGDGDGDGKSGQSVPNSPSR